MRSITSEVRVSRAWILTALGKDRPGIVAQVTEVLFRLGCNLEDSAMTRLTGEFAIMLVFSAPHRFTQSQLERAFAGVSGRLQLALHIKALSRTERQPSTRGQPYLLSVYGADRPGIVYRVSALLARLKINITDVSTHRATRATGRTAPLYLMLLEVELPSRITATRLERQIRSLTKKLGVAASLRSADTQVL